MSDRSWYPQAMRSYEDFSKRFAATDAKLQQLLGGPAPHPPVPPGPPVPPKPPLPPPPQSGDHMCLPPLLGLHGYVGQRGACRDAAGENASPRIEAVSHSTAYHSQ
jgi:alkanesulfonate monooxygenase SsuD/methylene tetrahydromethanopterin reductase-like flavin-dependent oxidoreductase (luciferase family)